MKNAFYGETGSPKGLQKAETLTIKKTFFNLHFKYQQNNNLSVFNVQIIRLSASVVAIFMYLTISKFKQVLRSQKGLDYNTDFFTQYWNFNEICYSLVLKV